MNWIRTALVLSLAFLLWSCSDSSPSEPEDTESPVVSIISPTTEAEFLTSESPIAVSGTASDNSEIDRVEWSIQGGASGTADGTTNWSIPSLALSEGQNVLTVTAYDAPGNSGSASLTITRDQTAPDLVIDQPTSSGAYNTIAAAVDAGGTASDDIGLDRVEWSVDGGASGTADGTEAWTVADLPLTPGPNEITITAHDLAGNSTSGTLTVHRFHAMGTMGLTPSAILTNSNQAIRITAAIAPDLMVGGEGVRLVEVDQDNTVTGERAQLLDNGDLENGDDILGDGVYSALVVISEAEEQTLRLQVVADVSGGTTDQARSPVMLLPINEPTSLEEDELQQAVQLEAASSLNTKLQGGTDLSTALGELVTEISSREGVLSVDADGTNAITIEFASGLEGGLLFTRTDPSGDQITRGGVLTGPLETWGTPPEWSAPASWRIAPSDTLERPRSATVPLALQTAGVNAWAAHGADPAFTEEPPADVILNRKVLMYAPYEAVWEPYNEGPDLVALLEDSPLEFDITYLQNQDATVEALQELTQYGLVVVATHGAAGRHLLTGEVATDEQKEFYDALRQAGQVTVFTKIEINQDESGAAVEADVFGITDAFISALAGTFPQSLIFNNSCESTMTTDLLTAFLDKGAEAYAGYDKVVHSDFAVDKVLELIEPMVSANLRTVAQSFQSGQTDPRSPNAEYEIWGNGALHFSAEHVNGGFEFGTLQGWTAVGDGRVITRLGTEVPVEGNFMGIISTGLGFTFSSGSIFQTFRVPEDANEMELHWNFLSEEFLEWIGSEYQDEFRIRITRPDGSEQVVYHRTVDDIAEEFNCPVDGGPNCQLIPVSPGIVFDQGDVHMTGWQTLTLDFTPYRGELITLRFEATDVGDSIFDTAILLDGLVIR